MEIVISQTTERGGFMGLMRGLWTTLVVFSLMWQPVSLVAAAGSRVPVLSEYQVEFWQTKDGLPQNSITSVNQSPDGFLWFGTFAGLARFDGVRFSVLNPATTPALGDGRILELQVDRYGALWVLCESQRVVRVAGGRAEVAGGRWGLPSMAMSKIGLDPDGNLWVRSAARVEWYRHTPKGFVLGTEREANADRRSYSIQQGRLTWRREGDVWQAGAIEPMEAAWRGGGWTRPRVFQRRDDGVYWVLDAGHVRRSDGEVVRSLTPAFDWEPEVTDVVLDAVGNIFVSTWGQGLFRINTAGELGRISLATHGQHGGPAENELIRSLFLDAEDNLWVATDTSGVLRVSPTAFRTVGPKDGLRNRIVKSVFEDREGSIWAVNGVGADIISSTGRVLAGPTGDAFWSGTLGDDGRALIGTYNGQLLKGAGAEMGLIPLPDTLRGIMALVPARQGGTWVGAHGGMGKLSGTNLATVELPKGLANYDVRSIADGRDGLSVGLNGAGLLKRVDGLWTHFTRTNGLPDDHVFSLLSGTNGVLWIGTAYGGLARFHRGTFFHYAPSEYPLPTQVSGMVEDGLGHLWLGSSVGIFRVRIGDLEAVAGGRSKTLSARRFGVRDGLETSECAASMQPTVCRGHDGRLWFATINGVSVVDPSKLTTNRRPPPVVIQEVRVDDRLVQPEPSELGTDAAGTDMGTGRLERFTVPSGNRRVLIQYAGLSFSAPERVSFKYRLEGLDPDWVTVGARRTAYYQGLGPGTYHFRVAACNEDGVWNEEGAVLSFVVLRAFWQTWWFRSLMVGALVGLVTAGYQLRLHRLRELDRMRLRIASDLHDEIGGNLGSIAINCEMLQSIPHLTLEERQDLVSLNRVAVQTAQAVRDIVWFINPAFDNSADMLVRMRDTAEVMLAGKECDFDGQGSGAYTLSLEFRRHVFALFKEALHNVVKHSGATCVEIRVAVDAERLWLRVRDNGRGFDPETTRGGHGLKSMNWRARELGARLEIRGRAGEGTCVELEVAMSRRRWLGRKAKDLR